MKAISRPFEEDRLGLPLSIPVDLLEAIRGAVVTLTGQKTRLTMKATISLDASSK